MKTVPWSHAARAALIASTLSILPALAAEPVEHLVGEGQWSTRPTVPDAMAQRIEDAAMEYAQIGQVARIGFFDIAYPADPEELAALRGHAVMLVSALSQQAAELPPRRVYGAFEGRRIELTLLTSALNRAPQSPAVAKVLGAARWDALYLVPVYLVRDGATIEMDFAKNREGFVLGKFATADRAQLGFPDYAFAALPTARPEPPAVNALAAREFPGFVTDAAPPAPKPLTPAEIEDLKARSAAQPLGTFRFIGNALVCKSKTGDEYACFSIGPHQLGTPYRPADTPYREIPQAGGRTAAVFPIKVADGRQAYWVIGHKDGRISSVQLTGDLAVPEFAFSSITLGDPAAKVDELLGPRFRAFPVPEIGGVLRDYAPFEITIEFIDDKVYSIRIGR